MSPIPLIARQRALSRIGEIRLGDEKQAGKVGRKLETFRLTSQHQEILQEAARLYGGEVKAWESPAGPAWQVITGRSSLDVLVIPGYSLRRAYEKWDGPSKRVRVCDGEEETISGQPCICNAQGRDECKILTRLMVLLPETGTSLGWQLSSTGETAADELDLAMRIAEGLAQGRPFVPGTLSITQRKGQLNGQATRFVVPVLGFNPQQSQLAAGELPPDLPALPSGYTPIPAGNGGGTSLEAGLAVAETQTLRKPPRVQLPDDDVPDDDVPFGDAQVPVPIEGQETLPLEAEPEGEKRTGPQTKKLNLLVGKLRDAGHLTTEQLWAAAANSRNIDVDMMVELLEGKDAEGLLHWTPLLQSLTKAEASTLIDRLERYEEHLGATEAHA